MMVGDLRKRREDQVARQIGGLIRARRRMLGLSQEKLGEALGITFQQIQKYEKGTNRVSAPTLLDMAKVLNVPTEYFFPNGDRPAMPEFELPVPILGRLERIVPKIEALHAEISGLLARFQQWQSTAAPPPPPPPKLAASKKRAAGS